ncbi:tRNA (adenosine(37)-N6)-threonylcarbamoyltransferase complex ATPase subunit type 1 TsaE [Methylophilaceae bacterium]|jgi:tRNA threonylcarbamoyladenosine biosynthesis protein TsaE|nr:tRNA (adenosine(37)-N6)-threonylcarbamoyltransferase complex ATPase subunit type 1 TsaE [Methylophilaceae bacterium]
MINVPSINLNNETATHELAKKIAQKISFGMLIYLSGDLGSGKTSFARDFIFELGFKGTVKSPSYSLVEQYKLDIYTVNHFDLYRFKGPEEWHEAGFNEFIDGGSINLIEWPEKGHPYLPISDLIIHLNYVSSIKRNALITANTPKGAECIKDLI